MIAIKSAAVGLATAAMLGAVPGATAQEAAQEAAPTSTRISWQPCQEPYFQGLDCGTTQVPVNWERPRSGQISLSLVRRKADDPARRVGSLMLNNGAGRSSIEQLRYALGPNGGIQDSVLAKRFDLVAVDPRGIGHSTPTTCGGLPQRAPGVTHFPVTDAGYQALVDNNRALAAACEDKALLANLDLANTARDMEAVRIGLGERQLDWYGIEWSAVLGKTYAQLFPGRLRTLFTDSALDDSLPPAARLASEIGAAEDSFNRFAAWCRTDATCVLAGQDVAAVFDQLVARADREPIPTTVPGRTVNGEDIRSAMQDLLNLKLYWPKAAQVIKKAIDGDASGFTRVNDKTLDFVQAQAHSCVDTPRAATNFAEFTQLARMAKQLSPHLGGAVLGWRTVAGCQGWPAPAAQPVTKPVRDAPPALIVQSTHQSSAAYSWGFGLSATLPGSVVLSRDGEDYSMYQLSPCVRQAVDVYMVDRRLPAPGTLCTD
ncbi:alpha/beta hydrolase family protein [Herbihabitans rhizosphaerae]|uniref:Alpha/beta hydrolase family protein n=1 Tax=Herbihabitans rhizosphaerae TaxID=1872711 RepID=A0A4Q7L678_9PSEU|nr:alpha/beta fold hydrolase [Herbihabitans rhizosphaerae]RZS44756.1 alpha/beta hydrolase family protein [Herbihabitans rhizosphaerae]